MVELTCGEEPNKPTLMEIVLPEKAVIPAGFHCKAPLISNTWPVEAPPIDILWAPTPCITCPVWAERLTVVLASSKIDTIFFI
jgi:hypothetical protein